jgi:predicted dehydrogenase
MTLRVIHVGVGGRGCHWLDFVAQRSDVISVACVDASRNVLDQARARPALKESAFFERLEDALRAVPADLVLLVTPSHLHAPQALQALDARLGVLIEKPLGLNVREAAAVVKRAHEVGRPVAVAENFRFFQAERTLRAFLDSGAAGRIGNVVCVDRRDQSSRTQGSWVKSMPHPFLTEIGVHHFDAFRYLFGHEPQAVTAMSYNPQGSDYDHEGGAHALLEFSNGLALQYTGTFVASRYEYEMHIEAEHGDIRSNRSQVWWRPSGERSWRVITPQPLPPGEVLRYPHAGMSTIFNQFSDALQRGSAPETSGADNLWTIAMVDAAILSAQENRKVPIAEVFPPSLRSGSPGEAS